MLFDDWTVADVCGATSIMCWLGAQLPQVIKNWQLQSCEGLALPFLINWLMGDFTNLIGCILTEQLPFQTYLATYFCFVDVALVWQYFYYKPVPPPSTPRHISPYSSLVLPTPTRSRNAALPASPHSPAAGLPRVNSGRGRRRTQPPPAGYPHPHPHVPHHANTMPEPYSAPADALYAAALDVARAAERVSNRRSHSGRPRARHHATAPSSGHDEHHNMIDSFHSEVSLPSSSTEDEDDLRRMTQSMGALDPRHDPRGRTLTRESSGLSMVGTATPGEGSDTLEDLQESGMLEVRRRGQSRSQSRARTVRGSGRRAAGVAFMSLGMLAWKATDIKSSGGEGHVILRHGASVADADISIASASGVSSGVSPSSAIRSSSWQPSLQHPILLGDARSTLVTISHSTGGDPDDNDDRTEEPVDVKQLIGRISAWCCTTLYLTSRLPQIWKNFQRKSVEGLSILLFLFAFLGNTFYVFSIVLAAPPPGQQAHYLLRALPYLLGSGGTLVFDLTIMIQAAIYGSARPTVPRERHRRSYSYGTIRRRRVHTEDGLSAHTQTSAVQGERRPLLSHSPVRSVTEPLSAWNHPVEPTRKASTSSTASASGGALMLRQSESPTQSSTSMF